MAQSTRLKDLAELRQLLPVDGVIAPDGAATKTSTFGHDGNGKTVRVTLDRAGRKGKTVTIISGLQHNPSSMNEIARILKQFCGAGGTVKGMEIEIQGDQRGRVIEKLRMLNYIVT